ncbi:MULTISPECIES: pheA operon leader peptide PheL [Symbiopectobacterium]|uniref:PheA operon leader peptide PheL n=1 Tax=Symbiopectobacterium purcellii TaxID=2871826 RepID=A0ABX9AU42_9ENTR|nr:MULTISPECIES: pheA operon leader peptide PheL [Symbiopectobacterium]MBG6242187.1 hypothetical protein [Candidatus Symbiopectobacterium sp. Dall1.0]MBG6248694.1 hypothetical protein [Candidatus Symbiopectobacterium sp. PLON1]MBT9428739.1 pheA operon leader peptide PheL [Candidatus Symbiopectobacterium endolongispinus]MCW2477069.1 pheA operon leader peptide PheL [Candidatus Symbiopectobacterium sp. NZEC151]MCW2480377.1 pheA operon leader peptide PheL [Candidatus Symbiopectobacterium sp. NZEC1
MSHTPFFFVFFFTFP